MSRPEASRVDVTVSLPAATFEETAALAARAGVGPHAYIHAAVAAVTRPGTADVIERELMRAGYVHEP